MSDVLATAYTPTLGVGRALRTYAIAVALAAHEPLDLVYVAFGADEPAPEIAGNPAIRLHAVHPSRGARRALAYASARTTGLPETLARGVNAEIADRVRELVAPRGDEPGRIIADGMSIAIALRGIGRPIIYNSQNLESSYQHHLGSGSYGSQRRMERFERRLLRRSSETWMVSHGDIEGARKLCPQAKLRYVPNVVDCDAITPIAPPPRSGRILLVADYTWPPNAQAAGFLTEEIMPLVWQQVPDARLVLAGRGLELDEPLDPRIEALGFVEDLEAQYAQAAVVAVPLLVGGGSPLKFIEGLAHGLPVVATPRAAQGLELTPGTDFLQGDDAASLAAALVRVLTQGADAVGAAGRALVERDYSIAALTALLAPSAP